MQMNEETENLDSENIEDNEEDLVDLEPEEEVEEESQVQDSQKTSDLEEKPDDVEARKQRKQSQIDRLKKERDDWKTKYESVATAPKETKSTVDDAVLARLENRGVMQKEDQEYVLKYAKVEGVSPVEALSDPVVQDKLAYLKKQREQRASNTTPGNRTGVTSKNVDYYISKNIIPKDPKMLDEYHTELARRSKEGI